MANAEDLQVHAACSADGLLIVPGSCIQVGGAGVGNLDGRVHRPGCIRHRAFHDGQDGSAGKGRFDEEVPVRCFTGLLNGRLKVGEAGAGLDCDFRAFRCGLGNPCLLACFSGFLGNRADFGSGLGKGSGFCGIRTDGRCIEGRLFQMHVFSRDNAGLRRGCVLRLGVESAFPQVRVMGTGKPLGGVRVRGQIWD